MQYNKGNLNKVIKSLKNATKNAKTTDGDMYIEIKHIFQNLEIFNVTFNTTFSVDSTNDDILEFFSNAYSEIVQDNIFEDTDAKEIFNEKFREYAIFE